MMECPRCAGKSSSVVDSRPNEVGIRRRRSCKDCGFRWSTMELPVADHEAETAKQRAELTKRIEDLTALLKTFEN